MSGCGRESRDFATVDFDAAGIRLVSTGNDFDEGGFACAVFAEEGVDFAGTEVEGNAFESANSAEGLGDVSDLEERVQSAKEKSNEVGGNVSE